MNKKLLAVVITSSLLFTACASTGGSTSTNLSKKEFKTNIEGIVKIVDKTSYVGTYYLDKRNGEILSIDQNGCFHLSVFGFKTKTIWTGECKNGYATGNGTQIATAMNGKRKRTYKGKMFKGKRLADIGNHKNSTLDINGNPYVGSVKNGKPHGKGTMNFKNIISMVELVKYEGHWKEGEFHGNGKLHYKDGGLYIGDFKNGKESGSGKFYQKDGTTVTAQYKEGKLDGIVRADFPDKNYIVAVYKNDRPIKVLEKSRGLMKRTRSSFDTNLSNLLGVGFAGLSALGQATGAAARAGVFKGGEGVESTSTAKKPTQPNQKSSKAPTKTNIQKTAKYGGGVKSDDPTGALQDGKYPLYQIVCNGGGRDRFYHYTEGNNSSWRRQGWVKQSYVGSKYKTIRNVSQEHCSN